ncbi:hypothetical protein QA612_13850 [Evansella sp. AB-P1]|nr:hypothetical protein [Evansella sp. AB-P1]MDG5788565.1 hypothetical protein [Evansella sp. AB-P1]
MEEYWDLVENPRDFIYQNLMNILCDYSDTFYFITDFPNGKVHYGAIAPL